MASRVHPVEIPAARPAHLPPGERLYAIGDIHGRLDLLAALVARIRHDDAARGAARVRLVLLGDLIDRGPDSAAVVACCRSLAMRWPGFVVLKGNHEAMMTDGLRGNLHAFALWRRHGGDAALRSWGIAPDAPGDDDATPDLLEEARRRIPADEIDWLDTLPPSHVAGDYLLVHAGIRPDVSLAAQSPQDMMWIRREFLDSAADHPFLVVHGHSIDESGVVVRPNRIGIDTGAYRTHVLTALALEGDRRWTLATGPADGRAAGDPGRLDADVAAILGGDDAVEGASARRTGPRLLLAAGVLASAASLVATLLLRAPDQSPTVQRYELVAAATPRGARVAVAPAIAARVRLSPPPKPAARPVPHLAAKPDRSPGGGGNATAAGPPAMAGPDAMKVADTTSVKPPDRHAPSTATPLADEAGQTTPPPRPAGAGDASPAR